MLGLTEWFSNGYGALAVFGSAFLNYVVISKMNLRKQKKYYFSSIRPLTQADVISQRYHLLLQIFIRWSKANGIIVSIMGLVITPQTGNA